MESYSITVLLFFNLIFNAFSEESKEFMEGNIIEVDYYLVEIRSKISLFK